jgi:hypothetical protein
MAQFVGDDVPKRVARLHAHSISRVNNTSSQDVGSLGVEVRDAENPARAVDGVGSPDNG